MRIASAVAGAGPRSSAKKRRAKSARVAKMASASSSVAGAFRSGNFPLLETETKEPSGPFGGPCGPCPECPECPACPACPACPDPDIFGFCWLTPRGYSLESACGAFRASRGPPRKLGGSEPITW